MNKTVLPSVAALVAFESAARHGSFTRAAAELNLTQGAISRQIRQLESQLGTVLFKRIRQRVTLTLDVALDRDQLARQRLRRRELHPR